MIRNERDLRQEQALDVAKRMMVAARTAPKGKGADIIECAVLTDDDIEALAKEMESYSQDTGFKFPLRDAANVRASQCVVILGTRSKPQGLNCAHCGYATCGEKPSEVPCEINSVDVGIALGSAVATAADNRVDSRIMFSAGMAAERLGLLGEGVKQVYAIPISIASKSPYFDRASSK